MPGFDVFIKAVIDAFHAQSSKREILHISGSVDVRNVIDTEPVPRINLADRNNLDEGPCGVPQYNFDLCGKSLHSVTITSSSPGPGGKFSSNSVLCISFGETYFFPRGSI
ncbi:hypothetical protein F4805DRAFT_436567 [Annulohypoxylon moriforme]|nr:hypothetical protein F4805DRAFT_436567 [Annulohypoxylon moriforme]